ncbi:MAK16 [Hepatospora eriocheir]|uniref:Protein MAK16 n=1 Tax=Hepatospora eriocheir TaxID=1081669 RepID=A0A1X0QHS9_9MICR|nr:MAK16 [Hepatospora eriocheir]
MLDRKIWESIGNKKTCSFKLNTKVETLCKNKYNVTGYCNEFSCPLANTKYATVRVVEDKLYLMIKEPERTHTPVEMYEKIELSYDYLEALKQLDENLEFWDPEVIHKCKQRLTKMFEYLERKLYLEENPLPQLTVRKTKMNRREKIRALKALNTLNFEKDISKELMIRLEEGIFGDELLEAYKDAKAKAIKHKDKRYVADIDLEENELQPKHTRKKKKKEKQQNLNW